MLLPCVSVLWGAELPPTAAASSAPHVPAPLCPPAHAAARRAGSQHDAEPWLPLEQGFSMETPVRNKMCRRGSARAIQSLCWEGCTAVLWHLHCCSGAAALTLSSGQCCAQLCGTLQERQTETWEVLSHLAGIGYTSTKKNKRGLRHRNCKGHWPFWQNEFWESGFVCL